MSTALALPVGINLDGVLVHDGLPTPDAPTRFAWVRDAGVFDYIEKNIDPNEDFAPYFDWVAEYGLPIGVFGGIFCAGRDEALLRAGFKGEELDGTWKPYKAVGCSACNNGYRGRVGIYQVMPISDEIQRIILRDGSSMDIAEQAQREKWRNRDGQPDPRQQSPPPAGRRPSQSMRIHHHLERQLQAPGTHQQSGIRRRTGRAAQHGAAALGGKVSGAETTTITFRNASADDTDRIVATVDVDGNRTAVTLDLD